MDSHKKEIIVTVVCAVCVGITAVLSAIIARRPATTYQVKRIPSFENVAATDYFPLKAGNTWEYVGTARNDTAQKTVIEKKVRVLMRVVDVTRGDSTTLFTMKGHPSDAAWALESHDSPKDTVEVPASTYGYLVVANKVLRIPEERLGDVKKAIKDGGFLKPELILQDDLEFEFPLFRGQVFGSPHQMTRGDRSYAWQVTDSTLYHTPGKETITEVPRYKLVYLTRTDYTEVSFVPYLGVVSFSYSHHGTTAQVDIDLQDYYVHIVR
jgi:hypothetical protein